MKTIAIAIQKGGTGKTTTAVNLAAALAAEGQKVLLIDNDPQGSTTFYSNIKNSHTISDVYKGVRLQDVATPWIEGVDVVTSDIILSQTEIEITGKRNWQLILKQAISHMNKTYDFCIIDAPPSLGPLTINVLAAADKVIIPLEPTPTAFRSLFLFFDTLDSMKRINPNLSYQILWTSYNPRLKLQQAAFEIAATKDLNIYPVAIVPNVRTAEAAGAHKPLLTFDPGNKNNAAYKTIAEMEMK